MSDNNSLDNNSPISNQNWNALIAQSGLSQANPFTSLVPLLDQTRNVTVYIRKSGIAAEQSEAFYLMAQHEIPHLLQEAGFPAERIIPLDEDTGISAWLNRNNRPDLQRQHDMIERGEIGAVIAFDISRLFRDIYLEAPVEFAKAADLHRTAVVTQIGGSWKLLNMSDRSHRDQFIDECRVAAHQRGKIRAQLMTAREQSARAGNYSGGPIPLGWAVRPRVPKGESPSGNQIAPQLYVYAPHKEHRLAVWRASLLPHIESYNDLLRHLHENQLFIPAFDPATAQQCLHKHGLRGTGFCQVQEFYPSRDTLVHILHDPLAVGFRLYGSGTSGKTYKKKLERLAKSQRQRADTLVRTERELYGYFPKLALWEDGSSEEREAVVSLFLAVQRKWAKYDFDALVRSQWRDKVPNPHQTAGKPRSKRVRSGTVNHWAQKVFCLKHEGREPGDPSSYPMALHGSGSSWECYRERARCERRGACSQWGDNNRLGRILDAHLHRALRGALDGNRIHIQSVAQSGAEREARIAQIEQDKRKFEQHLSAAMSALTALLTPTEESGLEVPKQETQNQIAAHRAERIAPIQTNISRKSAELALLRAEVEAAKQGEAQKVSVTQCLDRVLRGWPHLSVTDRAEAVQAFVERIGVWVGDGHDGDDALVKFRWRHGETHYLISWRSTWMDGRAWTREEDRVLRTLWPSCATWEEIRAKLQPGRKFTTVWSRAYQMKVGRGSGRTMAWREECLAKERSWADQNPDVFYLYYDPTRPERCEAVMENGAVQVMPLPASVRAFLRDCQRRGLGEFGVGEFGIVSLGEQFLSSDGEEVIQVGGIGQKKFARIGPLVKLH